MDNFKKFLVHLSFEVSQCECLTLAYCKALISSAGIIVITSFKISSSNFAQPQLEIISFAHQISEKLAKIFKHPIFSNLRKCLEKENHVFARCKRVVGHIRALQREKLAVFHLTYPLGFEIRASSAEIPTKFSKCIQTGG